MNESPPDKVPLELIPENKERRKENNIFKKWRQNAEAET
jgi:hypothetical protein